MISKEEVKHIAKLARLGLTEKDVEVFQKELSSVLDYFEKLEEVDVSGISPTSHSFETGSVMREDKESIKNKGTLLDLAPETQEGYLKVKSIL